MRDPILSAFAVLQLQPGTSLSKIKRRYKALVRKWHPDRFSGNPYAVAEATRQLRAINHAYEAILAAHFVGRSDGPRSVVGRLQIDSVERAAAESRQPLTRAEIEAIVAAIAATPSLNPDPHLTKWSRFLALAIALANVSVGVWLGWFSTPPMPAAGAIAPLGVIGFALVSVTLIWYSADFYGRLMGWALLVLFGVIVPLIATVIIAYYR